MKRNDKKTSRVPCFIIVILILSLNGYSQSPTWQWANGIGGKLYDFGASVVADADGNTYITGNFRSDSITFGSITIANNGYVGNSDVFIAKYDSLGNAIWALSAGGLEMDSGISLTLDVNGDLLVTGSYFSDSITFGTTTLHNNGGPCTDGCADVFIVKFDPSGNVIWAVSTGGNRSDEPSNITTDINGNVYIAGYFASYDILGFQAPLINVTMNAADVFVMKFDPNGTKLLAQCAGGTQGDFSSGLSVDPSGNVWVTGAYQSPTIFFGTTTLSNTHAYSFDSFIAKYDSAFNLLWAEKMIGRDDDRINDVVTNASGNAYVIGDFASDTLTIGTHTLINVGGTLCGGACKDVFIAKYNPVGNVLWAKQISALNNDYGRNIINDKDENLLIAGDFYNTTLVIGSTVLTNPPYNERGFIAKIDTVGNPVWAVSSDGPIYNFLLGGNSISSDSHSNTFMVGSFSNSTATFGSTTLFNDSTGVHDIFIAKLDYDYITNDPENIKGITDVSLFPNPFDSYATLYFNNTIEKSTVKIFDVYGKELRQTNFSGQQFVIERKELKEGIYFVQILQDSKIVASKKMIVQ